MYLGARKITSINTVLNILFFVFLLFRYEIPLTFLNISITAIILMIYYIFNVFNLEKGKYNFEDFVNSTIVYGVLIVIFSNILIFHRTKTIFTLLYLFQNLTKILFYYFYVRNRNILVIGNNGQVEELKEIIANNEYYNLVGELSADKISDINPSDREYLYFTPNQKFITKCKDNSVFNSQGFIPTPRTLKSGE